MRFSTWTAILFVCALLCLPSESQARRLFLNGVPIDGLINQTFVNVKVRIDAKGDVYIIGKQYRVKKKGQPANRPAPRQPTANTTPTPAPRPRPVTGPRPTKKYVAVIQRSTTQGGGYEIHIKINGQLAKKVTIQNEQDVVNVTPYLRKGSNRVEIEAYKQTMKAGGSVSVFIAPGKVDKGRVLISKPYLLKYKRTSAEKQNFRHIYNIDAQ